MSSLKTQDIYKRWHEHISDLKCGNHYNNHLQYDSVIEAEKDRFNREAIYKCCNGHTATHKGFIWSHKEKIQRREEEECLQLEKKVLENV